jgi:hypothetical protein
MRKPFYSFLLVCAVLLAGTTFVAAQSGVFYTVGIRYAVAAQTVADNGGGTAASGTVAALKSYVALTCSDVHGCDMTLSETGARDGMTLTIVNVSANVANFADTSGVSETAGSFAAGQWDAIEYRYVTDRWVELGRSNN